MNKTQKETEDAILKLIFALIADASDNNCTSLVLGFQSLAMFIKANAHFDESYVEQLKAFASSKSGSVRNQHPQGEPA